MYQLPNMQSSASRFKLCFTAILFISGLLFASCNCEDKQCPGLSDPLKEWYMARQTNNIRFTNGNGNEISFIVNESYTTAPKTYTCHSNWTGCSCGGCESPYTNLRATSPDSSRVLIDSVNNYHYYFNKLFSTLQQNLYQGDTARLYYEILGHKNSFLIDSLNNFVVPANDSLLPSFAIGGRTYNNVLVHHSDTTYIPDPFNYPNNHTQYFFFVKTSYFNKEYGVFAFFDELTQSWFYRE